MQQTVCSSKQHQGSVICLTIAAIESSDSNANSVGHILGALLNAASTPNNEKWLTVISAKRIESSRWRELGLNPRYARVIYVSKEDDLLWVTWEALANGNSHTVISLTPTIDRTDLDKLNSASTQGNTRGIILCDEADIIDTHRRFKPSNESFEPIAA